MVRKPCVSVWRHEAVIQSVHYCNASIKIDSIPASLNTAIIRRCYVSRFALDASIEAIDFVTHSSALSPSNRRHSLDPIHPRPLFLSYKPMLISLQSRIHTVVYCVWVRWWWLSYGSNVQRASFQHSSSSPFGSIQSPILLATLSFICPNPHSRARTCI